MFASKKKGPLPSGFLLFELMVSVVILAVALTVVSRTFSSSLAALKMASQVSQGDLLLEKKFWEMEQDKTLMPGQTEGTFEEFGGLYHWEVTVQEVKDLSLYDVRATVRWTLSGHGKQLGIQTYLPKKEEAAGAT